MTNDDINHNKSAVELIKILCIKTNDIKKIKSWNFIKKKLLNKDKNKIITLFLNKSIFEQFNALFIMINSFKDLNRENIIMSSAVKKLFTIKPSYIEIYLSKETNPEVTREGSVKYYINKNEFVVDIEPITNESNGYNFTYTVNIPEESKFHKLWERDIIKPLEDVCIDLLLYVINVTNTIIFPNMNDPDEYISN